MSSFAKSHHFIPRREILSNVIQCLRLLLEEMTEDLDPSLDNTAAKLRELKPDEEASQAKLWEYRVNIQALWEDPAIQVRRSLLLGCQFL